MATIRKPNFLVIGAQKSGTTYLCTALARHPSVFHSSPKEPLFFQRADVTAESFAVYLQTVFGAAGEQPWRGEGSAVYLQWPNALRNVRAYLGEELKIFVCLRQPTDRAVSFFLHNLKKGRFNGTERISQIGTDVRLSPVLTSLYADHIERWQEVYRDNIKFLLFDDLLASPEGFVREATDFLGLAPLPAVNEKAVNRGYALAWNGETLTVEGDLPESASRPQFTRSELDDLHGMFQADIDRTASLIGRSLTSWKQLPEFTAKHVHW